MFNAKTLIKYLGSYWSKFVDQDHSITQLETAICDLAEQTECRANELVNSSCRYDIDVYRTEKILPYILNLALKNTTTDAIESFSTIGPPGQGKCYGQTKTDCYLFPKPTNLKDFNFIVDNAAKPTSILFNNIDIKLNKNSIEFSKTYIDNLKEDQTQLFIVDGKLDEHSIQDHFGRSIAIFDESSEYYKRVINTLWDAYTGGGSFADIIKIIGTSLDAPVGIADETVEKHVKEQDIQWIATATTIYKFPISSKLLVRKAVLKNQSISSVFQYLRPSDVKNKLEYLPIITNYGPSSRQATILAENKLQELQTTDLGIIIPLKGAQKDIDRFWRAYYDNMPSEDIAINTITQYAQSETETTSLINPLHFFYDNILQYHTAFVKINIPPTLNYKTTTHYLGNVYKFFPPHKSLSLILQTDVGESATNWQKKEPQNTTSLYNTISLAEHLNLNITPSIYMRENDA